MAVQGRRIGLKPSHGLLAKVQKYLCSAFWQPMVV
jgi:hypothetical protein